MKFHGQENKKAHSKHVIVQQTDKDRRSGPVFCDTVLFVGVFENPLFWRLIYPP